MRQTFHQRDGEIDVALDRAMLGGSSIRGTFLTIGIANAMVHAQDSGIGYKSDYPCSLVLDRYSIHPSALAVEQKLLKVCVEIGRAADACAILCISAKIPTETTNQSCHKSAS
jgi:hypothetical protein